MMATDGSTSSRAAASSMIGACTANCPPSEGTKKFTRPSENSARTPNVEGLAMLTMPSDTRPIDLQVDDPLAGLRCHQRQGTGNQDHRGDGGGDAPSGKRRLRNREGAVELFGAERALRGGSQWARAGVAHVPDHEAGDPTATSMGQCRGILLARVCAATSFASSPPMTRPRPQVMRTGHRRDGLLLRPICSARRDRG